MRKTFRGGVHPAEHKEYSRDAALEVYAAKGDLIYPLSQHIGKPAKPVVKRGDKVLVGQKIAEADGFVSAPIYAACSGKVKAIEPHTVVNGSSVNSIIIQNDGAYNEIPGLGTLCDYNAFTKDEILAKIREAGIVGMGGAGFPTAVKLAPKNPEGIRYIIANGAECEPYITCDDQLMRTKSREIVMGMKVILSIFPDAEGVILIENNKPEAIAAMRKAVKGEKQIHVLPARTKYPQGGEKSIIKLVAGVDTKTSQLPAEAGCIVDNVGTIYAIYEAVCCSTPLIRRAVTVTGDAAAKPSNFIAPIGTLQSELVEAAGGIKAGSTVEKALSGGPMMGIAMTDLDVPLQKANNAITLLSVDEVSAAEEQQTACIRCGRCAMVCPMGLVPQMMADAAKRGDYEKYEKKLYGLECIQCGSCTFICPAKRPLMQTFKTAKGEIMARRRAEQAIAKAKAEAREKENAERIARAKAAAKDNSADEAGNKAAPQTKARTGNETPSQAAGTAPKAGASSSAGAGKVTKEGGK